ncbi:MAG: methyltransferase [Chloroflexaceae bacterium]|nr:methyltransferase [Chloroflexaceae bacterium]
MKSYERIYQIVRQIPIGKVATYGQVANLAGLPGQARLIGYSLFRVPVDADIPWHRVVNAKGEVSHSLRRHGSDYLQRSLLEQEGIVFSESGKINLQRDQWRSPIKNMLRPPAFQPEDES